MRNHKNLQVYVIDSDYFAMKWASSLIAKDPRTAICGESTTLLPLDEMSFTRYPDVLIIGGDFIQTSHTLNPFLRRLLAGPRPVIVLYLLNAVPATHLNETVQTGIHGLLLKSEVGMGLVPAVLKAGKDRFIYSHGLKGLVLAMHHDIRHALVRIPVWRPNPQLSSRQLDLALFRIIYGMRAASTAGELYVKPQTIEKYMTGVYNTLQNNYWADDSDFDDTHLAALSPEEAAFLWFTALPRTK
jgi:DNA-binding NarL/FixJ family response regulator